MKNILLIVDPQNDFITGSLAVEGAKEKMMDEYPEYHYGLYDGCFWVEPEDESFYESCDLKEPLKEANRPATWVCFFDGQEVGTVEAMNAEEAYEKMEQTWPELSYSMYDGVATVEPVTEALTEASKYRDSVEFHYDTLTTEIVTRVIPATRVDPEDYEEDYIIDFCCLDAHLYCFCSRCETEDS